MSIDLNKKYALTGSQLTKLKTYIDNSGGGDPAFFGCDEGVEEMNYLENIMPEILTIKYGGLQSWL